MAESQDRPLEREAQTADDGSTRGDPGRELDASENSDVDVRIDFTVSKDLLSVTVRSIHPPAGNGRPLSEQLLRDRLTQEGISYGVQNEAVSAFVATFEETGECDTSLILARGLAPPAGEPGRIEKIGDPEVNAALPGDVFVSLVPTRQPQPGRDVTGASIPAAEALPEVRLQPGGHCRLSEDTTEVIATVYGEPRIEGDRVFVSPGVRLEEEGLTCIMDVYPLGIGGQPIQEGDLIGTLEAAGVQREFMDLEALGSALDAARQASAVQRDVCVARGVAPEPGRDGQITFTLDIEERVGTLDDRGRIDFKEQNRLHRVHKDDQIAVLLPHTMGKPGLGVAGQEIPARPGRPVELRLGPGAREEDGAIFANHGGALVVKGTSIDVSNSFRVSGDVDYHSGNIGNDSGSVFVEGSVLAGFRITAGGDVEIGRSVEGGTVEAGGTLVVRDAIIGKEGATVRAAKDIHAAYIQNADLVCDGNLIVDRELIQSRVKVSGTLKLTGRPGAIVGGEIEADGGIVTIALGSSTGVPTTVRIGRGTRRISLLTTALNEKLEPLKQIRARLGAATEGDLLERLCGLIETAEAEYSEVPNPALAEQISRLKERRTSVRKLLRLHRELEAECTEIEEKLAEAEKDRDRQIRSGTPACIEVIGAVYPGVIFMIDGATFPVTKTYSAVRFFYNSAKRRVEARRNF